MKAGWADALVLAGLAGILAGVWQVSPPGAWIVGGVAVLVLGLHIARKEPAP